MKDGENLRNKEIESRDRIKVIWYIFIKMMDTGIRMEEECGMMEEKENWMRKVKSIGCASYIGNMKGKNEVLIDMEELNKIRIVVNGVKEKDCNVVKEINVKEVWKEKCVIEGLEMEDVFDIKDIIVEVERGDVIDLTKITSYEKVMRTLGKEKKERRDAIVAQLLRYGLLRNVSKKDMEYDQEMDRWEKSESIVKESMDKATESCWNEAKKKWIGKRWPDEDWKLLDRIKELNGKWIKERKWKLWCEWNEISEIIRVAREWEELMERISRNVDNVNIVWNPKEDKSENIGQKKIKSEKGMLERKRGRKKKRRETGVDVEIKERNMKMVVSSNKLEKNKDLENEEEGEIDDVALIEEYENRAMETNRFLWYRLMKQDKPVKRSEIRIEEVDSDGNCFYRALAARLDVNHDQRKYMMYKKELYEYVQNNKKFTDLMTEDELLELKDVKDKVWAGEYMIQGAKEKYDVNIVVLTQSEESERMNEFMLYQRADEIMIEKDTIILLYTRCNNERNFEDGKDKRNHYKWINVKWECVVKDRERRINKDIEENKAGERLGVLAKED